MIKIILWTIYHDDIILWVFVMVACIICQISSCIAIYISLPTGPKKLEGTFDGGPLTPAIEICTPAWALLLTPQNWGLFWGFVVGSCLGAWHERSDPSSGTQKLRILAALSKLVMTLFADGSPTAADSSSTSAVSEWGSTQWLPLLINEHCEGETGVQEETADQHQKQSLPKHHVEAQVGVFLIT